MNPSRSPRPIVSSLADIRAGISAAPHCDASEPRTCTLCEVRAVLPLDPGTRMAQPDATTHVCHPVLGGCNHGFTIYDERGIGFNRPEAR